jgi:hypothetical protein
MKTAHDMILNYQKKTRVEPHGLKKALQAFDRIIEEEVKNQDVFFQEMIALFSFKLTHQIME